MSDLDLVISNANIVDGTGRPAFCGNVGIRGDRIVAVGEAAMNGAQTIDAKGRVLSPGFIDIHTHYDPQLCWDRLATPSPEHGVTTLVAGNCSISLAPVKDGGHKKITALFGVVEDLEAAYFEASVPYSWESFGQYLDFIRPNLGPNVGMLLGHSALRFYVMGEDAQNREATPKEVDAMCAIFRTALCEGAFGLSLTYAHIDENGVDLPCAFAKESELLALCRVMADEGRGVVECAPHYRVSNSATMDVINMLGRLSLETGVMCSLSPILHNPHLGDSWLRRLVLLESWHARGAPLFAQAMTRPFDSTVSLARGSTALTKMPSWAVALTLPLEERRRALADRGTWPQLEREIEERRPFFDSLVVRQVKSPENERFIGRRVCDIAEEENRPYTDTLLTISCADNLNTEFEVKDFVNADPEIVSLLLTHPAIHVGAADAGAHIGQFCGAGDTCFLFEKFVRQNGYLTVEQAVKRLTGDLAKDWKITDRGRIAEGLYADLVIFDPETIARGEEVWVSDLPGGGGRFVRRAEGIEKVIVNGNLLVADGEYTQERSGRII